jgi:bacterioferritin (cytochrome b1)
LANSEPPQASGDREQLIKDLNEDHVTDNNKAMLQADLKNETETIRNYRQRVCRCEAVGEYAMTELIRGIPVNEQEHQIDLATALAMMCRAWKKRSLAVKVRLAESP